ncbi:hypothetical protein SY83_02835 [Paenibacillus swuensis]|uniref:DinB-like domain-containing protein n=1 Tax=Paenibacillus swuensis TaxID=1178515 RepID=A0A172TNL5_9BACL|nr:DinB family protein [Paenibacillus swuensis]ANE48679.1 hypothetical protein SY83_02835 [Paenibacillus swuensis]
MGNYLFEQLAFVRGQTLKFMQGVSEDEGNRIPEGFRNHIRWQLGHIYTVTERFAFYFAGLPMVLPDGFSEQFGNGTSPETPTNYPVPTLQELETLLQEQLHRIQTTLPERVHQTIDPPYVTSAGMRLGSIEEFLTFNLYHEGMHISMIKVYKKLVAGK